MTSPGEVRMMEEAGLRMESAAKLTALSVAATAEIEGMKIANEERREQGFAVAYDESAFLAVSEKLRKEVERL